MMNSGIWLFVFVIALFLAVGVVGYVISIFNSLIQVKNNVGKAWANIDVLLLQRNDEIVKLVDLCKKYMKHEEDLLRNLLMLRSNYKDTNVPYERINIENKTEAAIREFFLTGEQYPDLKADRIVQSMMKHVSEIEESISNRRTFLNDSVTIYNTQIEKIPYSIFAGILNYRRFPYLKTRAKQ